MNKLGTTWTILLALATCVKCSESDDVGSELDLMMPGVSPKQTDIYLCHSVALNSNRTMYITGIVPHANSAVVHHMGITGCAKPGSEKDTWPCSEFIDEDAPLCREGHMSIFMWAKNATELKLPDGVGFKVGGETGIQYLAMQIHYNNVDAFLNGGVDHSGVRVKFTFEPLPQTAAIMILGTKAVVVQPGQEEHSESVCSIDDEIVIRPIAFRVHAHQLGRVISGYRVRDNEWIEIGRRSPQLPHIFVPANPVPLTKGDMVAVRCTMFNFKNHTVKFGPTNDDEMCLFDILYYADGQKTFTKNCVFSSSLPYYWKNDKNLDVSQVPVDASVVPPPPNGPDPEQPNQLHHRRRGQFEQKKRKTVGRE